MNLVVHVLGKPAALFESIGDFKCSMRYEPGTQADQFVSLTMPVREAPYVWDDVLHPYFQMNLPEGYLLQVLQEQFGPVVGASPTALLSVIGKNMIGRVQVAPQGASLDEPLRPVDVTSLLQGDNSEQAFAELVRQHASSGVSGVVPKFLDEAEESLPPPSKVTLFTHRHIIKGSSRTLPYVSLNEHLCMEVARRVMPAARTEISNDGHAIVVHRFDVDDNGARFRGMEDFCSLLGLRPAAKYDTTWERMQKAVMSLVPANAREGVFSGMASLLLLNHALRNADCHAKNVSLTYTNAGDVRLAPAYDVVTTAAYAQYANNPPAISFMGKKTWDPGATLRTFIGNTFRMAPRQQQAIVERIGDAMVKVGPDVRRAMLEHKGFKDVGKRMLSSWSEGLASLRSKRIYAMGDFELGSAFVGFSDPVKTKVSGKVIGRSELLGKGRD